MIIDCKNDFPWNVRYKEDWSPEEWAELQTAWMKARRRVFVNEVEIFQVFYVDTDAGFVRTRDVFGDNVAHLSPRPIQPGVIAAASDLFHHKVQEAQARDIAAGLEPWDIPPDGVMSKTIRGVVRLEPVTE